MTVQHLPDWDDVFLTAALHPDRWLESLDVMARHTGATHGQLIGIGRDRDVPFNLVTNFAAADLKRFSELEGGASPQANFRVAASAQHIERGYYDPILHERHYDAVRPGLTTERYLDFCADVDIPFGCQTNLVVDGMGLIGFAALRGRKDGRTTAAQRRIFANAAAAARRAVRLQERLEGEQGKFLAGAFETIGVCAFVLDVRGQVLAQTTSADAYLSSGAIRMANRQLDAAGTPMSLRQATDLLTRTGGLRHLRLRVERPEGMPPLFLEGFRLPERSWSLGRLPHAILIANAPQRDRAGVSGFLTALYGLSSAEGDIAMRLYEGKSRQDVAGERKVTVETLRGQIKTIYRKTGTDGEAGLMRLLSAIMA